jgi:hypothetical protein
MPTGNFLADKKLVILWTTADQETAERMVFMYARNSKIRGWWEEVCLVVWGASQRLLCESPALQEELAKFQEAGGEVQACLACAELYGLTEKLRGLGIKVKRMGEPLTRYLKQGLKVISI